MERIIFRPDTKALLDKRDRKFFVFIHDTVGKLSFISSSIKEILGYSRDEFISKPFLTYLTENKINEEGKFYSSLTRKGEPQPSYKVEVFHKDGSTRILEVFERPKVNEKWDVISVEGVAVGIGV
ncbi:PAS domain S-box protein [Candidatus Riflebacteria bacterium]